MPNYLHQSLVMKVQYIYTNPLLKCNNAFETAYLDKTEKNKLRNKIGKFFTFFGETALYKKITRGLKSSPINKKILKMMIKF